jgi:rhomboid protease GlpG
MIELARVSLEVDLAAFSAWLNRNGIAHRVVESEGQQLLLMSDSPVLEKVQEALNAYLSSEDVRENIEKQLESLPQMQYAQRSAYDRVSPQQAPLVFLVMLACVMVAWLTDLGDGGQILRSMLIINPMDVEFNPNTISGRWDGLVATLAMGEIWRLFTPDLLHFNVAHITFNLLMFWVLGGQVEFRQSSFSLAALIVVVSIASNIAQLLDGGYLFGGLSGVVYGLFGYCWVWAKFQKEVFMPDSLFRFALVWLIIGYTPLTEWVGLGRMANSAHLYGLLSGLIWAWCVFGLKSKGRLHT